MPLENKYKQFSALTYLIKLEPHECLYECALPTGLVTDYDDCWCVKWLVEVLWECERAGVGLSESERENEVK